MSKDKFDASLDALERERQNILPTPPIGEIVYWYQKGHKKPENAVAAMVTKQEAPGRVALTIFPPSSREVHKVGVMYCESPLAKDLSARATVINGSWGYREGYEPAKKTDPDYQLHQKSIDARRAAIIRNREAFQERAALVKQGQEAEAAAASAK